MLREAHLLDYDLTMQTTGASLKMIKSVKQNNDLETDRLLRRWRHSGSKGKNMARLQRLLQWEFGNNPAEILDSIAAWEAS